MKMKIGYSCLVAVLTLGVSSTASADFSGNFNVSNWLVSDNAGGLVNTSGAPASITLTSGNSGIGGDTFFTITANTAETISFNWSYVTNDLWGESGTDAFGYVVNGVVTPLIDPNQSFTNPAQSGIALFTVNAGDVFGFDANTLDGWGGSSVTVVSNFTATASSVPAPAPLLLWLFGSVMAGFAGFSRRNKSI